LRVDHDDAPFIYRSGIAIAAQKVALRFVRRHGANANHGDERVCIPNFEALHFHSSLRVLRNSRSLFEVRL
jgi:hypothetical protein